ncbi:hypothetical protein P7K49_019293 [Saguinus oedipus]|uniref:Uncharacterized protein n=1 Tax=Saguinus oedipus TaxID=9490 RepID=A0ABQ9UX08_SAGOE|nr:hypothetical protein P7K49_019293 [Saguinus oedipus]
MHIQGLQEELAYLKKSHNEEISAVGGQVNGEVDSAPGGGLAMILGDTLVTSQTEELSREVTGHREQIQISKFESQTGSAPSAAVALNESCIGRRTVGTEACVEAQLVRIQALSSGAEVQLGDVCADRQRPEQEITTDRILLERQKDSYGNLPSCKVC